MNRNERSVGDIYNRHAAEMELIYSNMHSNTQLRTTSKWNTTQQLVHNFNALPRNERVCMCVCAIFIVFAQIFSFYPL